jgi:excisionase family DNA binding protein
MSKLVTISQAAEELGVSAKTVRRWEESGLIRGVRTYGGHRRFDLDALREVRDQAESAAIDRPARTVRASEPERQEWWDEVDAERASLEALKVRTERADFLRARQEATSRAEDEERSRQRAEEEAVEAKANRDREAAAHRAAATQHEAMLQGRLALFEGALFFQPDEARAAIRKALIALCTPANIPRGTSVYQVDALIRAEIDRVAGPYNRVVELRRQGARYAEAELLGDELDYAASLRVRKEVDAELQAMVKADWSPARVEQFVDDVLDGLLGDESDDAY